MPEVPYIRTNSVGTITELETDDLSRRSHQLLLDRVCVALHTHMMI